MVYTASVRGFGSKQKNPLSGRAPLMHPPRGHLTCVIQSRVIQPWGLMDALVPIIFSFNTKKLWKWLSWFPTKFALYLAYLRAHFYVVARAGGSSFLPNWMAATSINKMVKTTGKSINYQKHKTHLHIFQCFISQHQTKWYAWTQYTKRPEAGCNNGHSFILLCKPRVSKNKNHNKWIMEKWEKESWLSNQVAPQLTAHNTLSVETHTMLSGAIILLNLLSCAALPTKLHYPSQTSHLVAWWSSRDLLNNLYPAKAYGASNLPGDSMHLHHVVDATCSGMQ